MVVKYIRLLILETFHVQNEEEGVPELRLLALENCGDDPDGTLRKILLRDSWIHTPVVACDVVHFIFMHSSTCTSIAAAAEPSVTDDFASLPRLLVDDTCNALIVHPDILASPTRIAESVMCGRMAVLSTRLPSSSSQKHSSAILGTLKHELFERALEYSCSDGLCPEDSMLQEWSQDIVRRNLGGLIAVNLTSKDAINDLRESIPHLTGWLTQFVVEEEFAPAASTSAQNKQQLHPELHIASLVATEEEIWSPVWGLRGFLDATVQVEMHGGSSNEEKRSYILALELKTGSRSDFARIDHRAQVILYSLLLQGMYGPDVSPTMGVLVYINSEMGAETQIVSPSWHEVRALLQARNQHAHDVESASSSVPVTLPPPLQRPQQCSRCFQAADCMLYNRVHSRREPAAVKEILDKLTGHLSESDLAFFGDLDDALGLESRESAESTSRRIIWLQHGVERELSTGLCMSNMHWEGEKPASAAFLNGEAPAHVHMFTRKRKGAHRRPLSALALVLGDRVMVSVDMITPDSRGVQVPNPRLLSGKIVYLTDDEVQILSRERMRFPGTGLTSSIYRATTASAAQSHDMEDLFRQLPPLSFRLDKDDVTVGITTLRSFLARLFVGSRPSTGGEGHSLGNEKCRRLIIDLEEPRFSVQKELFPTSPAGKMLEQEFYESLNSDQRSAIRLALAAQDYALLLGMPGTGKTATICFLVRLVVSRGGTVLIASYTHSAVDNILMRLLQAGVHCLRLASTLDSVHPGVREACLLQKTAVMTTTADYARELLSAPVVGTTCLGVRNSLCERREFDLCLVDEAGQITIPAVLGSISCARTFILVGDHFQLPPLVLSKEATTAGLGVSLLRRLCEAHPAASVQLSIQYRMNSDITELCNTLVYGNRLRCANAAVAGQSVQLDMDAISSHDRHIPDWLASILSPKVSIALLNTDSMVQGDATFSAAESSRAAQKGRGGITNTVEVTLTDIILWCLLHLGGMDSQQVGVISPYRSQVALLQTQLLSRPWAKDIEVNTIDKFQGRDKVLMVVSFVRSNSMRSVGDLLRDWRRINVAMSRARAKLLLIGSVNTISSSGILRSLVGMMRTKNWIHDLPADACKIANEI